MIFDNTTLSWTKYRDYLRAMPDLSNKLIEPNIDKFNLINSDMLRPISQFIKNHTDINTSIIVPKHVLLMLFLLNHYNPTKSFMVSTNTHNVSPETLEPITKAAGGNKAILCNDFIDKLSTDYAYANLVRLDNTIFDSIYHDQKNCYFYLISTISGSTSIINHLCEQVPHNKAVETFLTDNPGHKLFVSNYKDTRHNNTSIAISNLYSAKYLRTLIALTPINYPELTIPENIKEIFKAYGEDDFDKWAEAYIKWMDSQNFERLIRIKTFEKCTQSLISSRERIYIHKISEQTSKIDDITTKLMNYQRELLEYQKEYLYFQTTPHNDEELLNYLVNHRYLTRIVDNTNAQTISMILDFKSPLRYYDEDAAQKILTKKMETEQSEGGYQSNRYIALSALYSIFVDKKATLYTTSNVKIEISQTSGTCSCNRLSSSVSEGVPQPHIILLNCFGDNKPVIIDALQKNELIMAIEQITAATCNINFFDSTVLNKFIGEFSGKYLDTPCILYKSQFITPKYFVKEIVLNEANNPDSGTDGTDASATANPA